MNVLISGASMAGLSAAYWFAQWGHQVTVVERATGLRLGGAPIDVRGLALGTAERMGILGKIAEEKVVIDAPLPVFDAKGSQVATMDLRWFANETDQDIEITRDRLNQILCGAIPEHVAFHYETTIASIVDGADGVSVAFSNGASKRYDLVVGADGLHSNVRRLAFGPEQDYVRHFGFYIALVNLPRDRDWQLGKLSVPGMMVGVRDVGDGPLGMMLVASDKLEFDFRDLNAQRKVIDSFLSRVDAWQVPALRAAFTDPAGKGFYFDSVSQTHMPGWTKGNVAVIGDAGHCAALLSGMGTTLAMVSAEILADTWTEFGGNMDAASAVYHERLRPYVEQCQALAHNGAPIMVPATQEALNERNAMFRGLAVKFAESSKQGAPQA